MQGDWLADYTRKLEHSKIMRLTQSQPQTRGTEQEVQNGWAQVQSLEHTALRWLATGHMVFNKGTEKTC